MQVLKLSRATSWRNSFKIHLKSAQYVKYYIGYNSFLAQFGKRRAHPEPKHLHPSLPNSNIPPLHQQPKPPRRIKKNIARPFSCWKKGQRRIKKAFSFFLPCKNQRASSWNTFWFSALCHVETFLWNRALPAKVLIYLWNVAFCPKWSVDFLLLKELRVIAILKRKIAFCLAHSGLEISTEGWATP